MRFLKDNLISAIATVATGTLTFGLQSYAGHNMSPANYGRTFALFGFYGILTRPARSFGRQVAWHMSRRSDEEINGPSLADSVLLRLTLWLFSAGIVIGLISTAYSAVIANFFHAKPSDVLVTAWAAPFVLGLQTLKGALEGERRFLTWSAINVMVPALYVVGVVSLLTNFQVFGVLLAMALGSTIGFFVCVAVLRQSLARAVRVPMKVPWLKDLPFLTNGIVATLTNGVFLSADVVVIQHYLSHQVSGQYAVVAAIGNILFSVTTGVVNVMFPYVAERQSKGLSAGPIVFSIIGIFALGTAIGAIFLQFFGAEILRFYAGSRYIGGASYLGWYAIGMGILSWSTTLMHAQQVRNRFTLLWALIPALVARVALLLLFHKSPLQVVLVTDALVLVFATSLFAMFLKDESEVHRKNQVFGTKSHETAPPTDDARE